MPRATSITSAIAGTPDGVQDVFQYTLADAAGASRLDDADHRYRAGRGGRRRPGVVSLPAGVEMSDIHVNGRDLVIDMPDGTQMVIPNGAVFVPQLAIGDVEVPATNLAALLINSEPQPAAGPPQSSGGNFAVRRSAARSGRSARRPHPADRARLLAAANSEELDQFDRPQADGHHRNAGQSRRAPSMRSPIRSMKAALPARRAREPEGTLASQDIETTNGTIVFTAEDGLDSVTINGADVTAVNQQITGAHGVLTITSIDLATGQIGYSYTATDNTTDGVDDFEDFTVVVTDRTATSRPARCTSTSPTMSRPRVTTPTRSTSTR